MIDDVIVFSLQLALLYSIRFAFFLYATGSEFPDHFGVASQLARSRK